MAKFKVGDKVRVKKSYLEYIFSNESDKSHIKPQTGDYDEYHTPKMYSYLSLLIEPEFYGVITKENWKGTDSHNFEVTFMDYVDRIEPNDLIKFKGGLL